MDPGGRELTELEAVEHVIHEMRDGLPDKAEIRAMERLLFIRLTLLGYGMEDSCRIMHISLATGYTWKSAWESEGFGSVFPHYGGGRRCLLTPEQLAEAGEEVAARHMTTAEAREFIRRRYGVEYSTKQVGVRLRGLGLRHVRPYEIEFDSEEEAERVLRGSSVMRWTRRGRLSGSPNGSDPLGKTVRIYIIRKPFL